MSEGVEDVVANRRYALASLVRAFAWPLVAVGGIAYFGSTIDRMALATQSVKFAGIEIQRWRSSSRLSDAQIKKLSNLAPEEIVEFATGIGRGSYYCIDDGAEPRPLEKLLIESGLAEVQSKSCGAESRAVVGTIEGRRLAEALQTSFKEIVGEQLSVNQD